MKFSIRDILWLTVAVALGVGWWIDRSRLAIPAADYRRLKSEQTQRDQIIVEYFDALRLQNGPPPTDVRLGPDGLRHVPGNKDYQFPPDYPLFYGPSTSPPDEWEGG